MSSLSSQSSPSNRKRKLQENDSIQDSPKRFHASSFDQQNFSLPSSMIYYVFKNPSTAKIYQKLIQTCKYFFIKNPILIIPDISIVNDDKNGWEIFIDKKLFKNLKNLSIWITDSIIVNNMYSTNPDAPYSFISNIYRCDAEKCQFLWSQDVPFKDVVFLASKTKKVLFNSVSVVDDGDEGLIVALEKLVAALPNVKNFSCLLDKAPNVITSKTVQKLLQIQQFKSLEKFYLSSIPECFDMETFYTYLKENKNTVIDLEFDYPISEVYQNRLQEIVDEIIQSEHHDYKIPYICFNGINETSLEKLDNLGIL